MTLNTKKLTQNLVLNLKTLVLASQSPRRAEILKNANYFFIPFPVYVSEIPNKNLRIDEQIIDIARRKAVCCAETFPDQSLDALILASDTMVCLGDITLGKPNSEEEAFDFLKMLSGKIHQVKTAVVLQELLTGKIVTHLETTDVHFKELSDLEIQNYIQTKEPMDKAGAYAIQGLGRDFVKKYVGDFDNVVGLPLQAIQKIFTMNQWQFKVTL